jgi:methyltransferase (TIGR00027 family)
MAETCSHQDQTRSKVSSTAHLVAYIRSIEAKVYGEQKLFDDPYASILSGEVGERSIKIAEEGASWTPDQKKRFLNSISVRTRTIDDYVMSCIQDHGIEQIVVLGAGLDTRPWRLHPNLPATSKVRYFEIDFPEVFNYKLDQLQSIGASPDASFEYHNVVADLSISEVWPQQIAEAGFVSTARSLWILEGFCNYLQEEELRQVINTIISISGSGSHLIATMATTAAAHFHISMHRFWPEQALAFFQSCGPWQGREDDVEDLAVDLNRKTPPGEEKRGYFIVRVSLP